MAVDEELSVLEDTIRRLKVEYDIFFGGGSKKPPREIEWRVQILIKKYADSQKLNFAQRFRYNSLIQKYALFNTLWQQKLKIKEEGYRRPQDAILGIQGIRQMGEDTKKEPAGAVTQTQAAYRTQLSDPEKEEKSVHLLFKAMTEARQKQGEQTAASANLDSFKTFLQRKTEEIRKQYGCHSVEYAVEVENGQVRLKAKAKI